MADFSPVAASPLDGKTALDIDGLSINEERFLGKITLRGDAENKEFAAAAKKALGCDLPTEPMTTATKGDIRVFWIAFDEWLIWTPDTKRQATIDALESGLKDIHNAVVDVSDYYTVIRVSGGDARDLLSKGVLVDLHEREFPVGKATGTMFHHATIFITRLKDKNGAPVFDVMIRWSFATYLWDYLMDGAREFGATAA